MLTQSCLSLASEKPFNYISTEFLFLKIKELYSIQQLIVQDKSKPIEGDSTSTRDIFLHRSSEHAQGL